VDLDLLKLSLTGISDGDPCIPLAGNGYRSEFNLADRRRGADWPAHALTMIGLARLDNIQQCVEQILADGIPGDLIETGVWRGGACIFMRALLKAHGVTDRTVWVADSFAGMPPAEHGGEPGWGDMPELAVSLDEVRANFASYGLLDDQVRFLPGWFADTLPTAPIGRVALLRLDGDLYSSTRDALAALGPKVAPGGFVIVNDWWFASSRKAVEEYRDGCGITEPVIEIDYAGAFWRAALRTITIP